MLMRRAVLACLLLMLPLAAQAGQGLPVLVYHQLRESGNTPADSLTAISLQHFEQQMRLLHDEGYTTLSSGDIVAYLQGKPFPENSVAIHFDDGWRSAKLAIPVLRRYGFKASFFIIAGAGEPEGSPHLTWAEILPIAQDAHYDMQSHSMTHPWKPGDTLPDWQAGATPGKSAANVAWELAESRRQLEEKLGRPVPMFAWPKGYYNDALIAQAQQAGYTALFTVDGGLNQPGGDVLRIRRTMVDGRCGIAAFRQILLGGMEQRCVNQ